MNQTELHRIQNKIRQNTGENKTELDRIQEKIRQNWTEYRRRQN